MYIFFTGIRETRRLIEDGLNFIPFIYLQNNSWKKPTFRADRKTVGIIQDRLFILLKKQNKQ